MDAVQDQMKNPTATAIGGLVVGVLLGWLLLGWVVFPVEWTDASPADLRPDLQEEYLRMAIDSYAVHQNAAMALDRYESLGEDADAVLAAVAENPGAQAPALSAFTAVVQAGEPVGEETPAPGVAGTTTRTLLLWMCGITLVLAAALGVVFFLRRQGEGFPRMDREAEVYEGEPGMPGEEAPLAQFMTTYMLGDDLFDDSFSIDSPAGEFLGECGVGIAEPIGVGEPKRVSAFELWLFDKNDIQTVTKVLMSAHAYNDETAHQRLAAKGEPVLAEPGKEITLETATLDLVARVVDMSYGEGALPDQSFFERITLELAVWEKS